MTLHSVSLRTALAAAFLLAGCTAELTEIVVVVDSDHAIDQQLDEITIQALGFGDERVIEVPLVDQALPITLGLVHDGGALGPITVEVTGKLDGRVVVVAKRTGVSFVRGQTLMLRLDLLRVCDGLCIGTDQTCREGVCGSAAIGDGELMPWRRPLGADASVDSDAASGSDGGGGTGGGGADGGMIDGGVDATVGIDSGLDAALDAAPPFDAALDAAGPDAACSVSECDAGGPTAAINFPFPTSNFDPSAVSTNPDSLPVVTIDCGEVVYDTKAKAATGWCSGQPLPLAVEVDSAIAPKPMALAFGYLRVAPGSTLRLVGEQPAIIAVFGDAWIDGTIDVSAVGATAGAGGNVLCDPGELGVDGAAASAATNGAMGGGGGALGSDGGSGGLGTATGAAPSGGRASVDADLVPLRGGCPGGRGGNGFSNAVRALAGAGGGAVQLSVAGDLYLRGVLAAGGGGGRKASPPNTGNGADGSNGGGGGGSGGAILIEAGALHLAADAWLTANGGGGGAGLALSVAVDLATVGSDGSLQSASPAPGGAGGSMTPALIPRGGSGGAGAAGAIAAIEGANAVTGLAGRGGGGGGGGGAGRIRINRAPSCSLSGSFSPEASIAPLSGSCP